VQTVRSRDVREGMPDPSPHAVRCEIAATPLRRLRGLLGRPPLAPGEGLLLVPAASVHTCGMRTPVDVAFLDDRLVVLRTVERLAPWRVAGCRGACAALELASGSCARSGLRPGARLELVPAPRGREARRLQSLA
jgi:uncharacterized protein